jgi:AraC-like DNA-binding protein
MEIHLPTRLLSPFIKHYLIIESQEGMVNRTLPDTSLVMSFRYKGQVSFLSNHAKKELSAFTLTGLRRSDRLISYAKDTANILVMFREAAAHAFIKEPLHEIFEDSVSLDNFAGYRNLSVMEEQLAEAAGNVQRIALIEQFLLSRLFNQQPDQLITAALEKIQGAKGIIKIKELTKALYISQDAFEKRFRRTVGVSPKQFAYITKMKAVVNSAFNKRSLAEIAFDAGYYDQPHFNKDFKLFTGQTPTDFIKNPVIM